MSDPAAKVLELRAFAVCLVGNQWIGMATVAGIQVRGRGAPDPVRAVQHLLWEFTNPSGNDTAKMALEMALEGVDLAGQIDRLVGTGQLPAGAGFDAIGEHPDAESARQAERNGSGPWPLHHALGR